MGTKKRGSTLRGPFIGLILFVAAVFVWRYFYFDSFSTISSYVLPGVLPSTTKLLGVDAEAPCACTPSNASCPHEQGGGEEKVKVVVEEKIVEKVVEKVVEVESKDKPWYAKGKVWHAEKQFNLCNMDVCFNFSRCQNQDELLIYYYDIPNPPSRYFEGLNMTSSYTSDPDAACLFFVFPDWIWTPTFTQPWELPHWNHGLNHVIVTFADIWYMRNPPPNTIGNASVLGSNLMETTYRPGFDIGIPLPGHWHSREFQAIPALKRKYLLTFRGTRYVGPYGEGIFRSSDKFRNMHNGKDVVIATTCDHPQNRERIEENSEFGAHCDEDEEVYKAADFTDLMNSTFALAPAGISCSSYRLIELMSGGAIPVVIADNYVKPFDNLIQWPRCMLQFPTEEMDRIVPALRKMSKNNVRARQKYCLWVYEQFLKDDDILLRSAIRALKARFYGMFGSFSDMSSIYSR